MSYGHEISVEIGGLPILLRTQDPSFKELLANRYEKFLGGSSQPRFAFDVDLISPRSEGDEDEDAHVEIRGREWHLRRGDFFAQWDPAAGHGTIRQSANPYSLDSVLRIVHTLVLAREGGFLLHAASAIRNGRAFLFSGISGAGKTTISSLIPADATLLTDEISYVRRGPDAYDACGTPFAGELARVGENQSAPIGALYFLAKGPKNKIENIAPADAARSLMRNILFFAEDAELVNLIFQAACEFVERVPVRRLTFFPDTQVWNLIA
jgi:hypothetical protein